MSHLTLVPDLKKDTDESVATLPTNVVRFEARFDAAVTACRIVGMAYDQEALIAQFEKAVAGQARQNQLLRAHVLKVCVFEQLMLGARFKAFGFKTAHEMSEFLREIYLGALV